MQQQKSQDVFLRPSFPGHLLEMSHACGLRPPHMRHSCAVVHVNLDVQKSFAVFALLLLAFYFQFTAKGTENFVQHLCPRRRIFS